MTDIDRTTAVERRLSLLAPLLLVLLVLAVYGQTLGYGFTGADDNILLTDSGTAAGWLGKVAAAFQSDVFGTGTTFYRPLLRVSFLCDTLVGGGKPWAYHCTNVALHALACLVLFWFLLELGLARTLSFAAAGLFAVHPAGAMAVAWIPGRNDVMLALFVLLACLSLVKYLRGHHPAWFVVHAISAAAAMFTKETGAIAPAAYLIVALAAVGRRVLLQRRQAPLFAIWLLTLACWLLLRQAAIGGADGTPSIMPLAAAGAGVLGYVGKLFWPSTLQPIPGPRAASWMVGLVAVAVAALLALIGGFRRRDLAAAGILWYLLFLLPAIIFRYTSEIMFLEHRQYLASAGLLLAATQLAPLQRSDLKQARAALILAALLAACGAKAGWYSRTFTNRTVFWKTALITSPRSAQANNGYGNLLAYQGKFELAREYILQAVTLEPGNVAYVKDYRAIGTILARQRAPALAPAQRPRPVTVLRVTPDQLLERAAASAKAWELEPAIAMYQQYLGARPRDAQAHYLLGFSLAMCERWDQAAINFRRAIVLGLPDSIQRRDAWFNLELMYRKLGTTELDRIARDSIRTR